MKDTVSIIFGDSISYGLYDKESLGWVNRARLNLNNNHYIFNLAIPGQSSKDILTNNNLFLSKQNGKYGFVDKEGKVIVDYIYDDAREQNDYGYVAVKKDGLWGSLDKNGNTVADTKYNLEDNLVIDFIGEYHLGVDLNLNYYTK